MDDVARSTQSGDLVTADHKFLNVVNESRCGHRSALIVQDDHTNSVQGYPMQTQGSSEITACLQRFFPPSPKPGRIFTHNSKEVMKACQD